MIEMGAAAVPARFQVRLSLYWPGATHAVWPAVSVLAALPRVFHGAACEPAALSLPVGAMKKTPVAGSQAWVRSGTRGPGTGG